MQNDEFIIASIFIIYNFIAFSFMRVILEQEGKQTYINILYWGTFISIIIQTFALMVNGINPGRNLGFFNNPNQLGYYALLALALILLLHDRAEKTHAMQLIISILCTVILMISSLSNAGMLSYAFLIIYYVLFSNASKKFKMRFFAILLVAVIAVIIAESKIYFISENPYYQQIVFRLQQINNSEDRGYGRLLEKPYYMLMGGGEGGYTRFLNNHLEFHSTLGNILLSYGFEGFFLFLTSLYFAVKNSRFRYAYLLFAIMLYGLTHNGLRNTLLWVFIALLSSSGFTHTKHEPSKNVNNKFIKNR